jgi:hypothetical protein
MLKTINKIKTFLKKDKKKEDLNVLNNCDKIATLPQFGETCWFNAILMAVLYSEGSRKIFLKESIKWDINSDNFKKIIKTILHHHYNQSEETTLYFNKLKPEAILFTMLEQNNEKILINYFKNLIKKTNESYSNLAYIPSIIISKFYDYLNINALELNYIEDDNVLLFNYMKSFTFYKDENNEGKFYFDHFNLKEKITKSIKNIPDILILQDYNINTGTNNLIKQHYNDNKKYLENFYSTTYGIKNIDKSIKNFEDIIIFNGNKYKLDSCILTNYNDLGNNKWHAIAGLSCNNNRYIYNGWSIPDDKNKQKYCPLIKLNWSLKESDDFCLPKKSCQLENVDSNDLCFSFNKGLRTLIYVKINNKQDDDILLLQKQVSSPAGVSKIGISKLIDIFHDIEDKSTEELVDYLREHYKIILNSYIKRDTIKDILIKTIKKEKFNIPIEFKGIKYDDFIENTTISKVDLLIDLLDLEYNFKFTIEKELLIKIFICVFNDTYFKIKLTPDCKKDILSNMGVNNYFITEEFKDKLKNEFEFEFKKLKSEFKKINSESREIKTGGSKKRKIKKIKKI